MGPEVRTKLLTLFVCLLCWGNKHFLPLLVGLCWGKTRNLCFFSLYLCWYKNIICDHIVFLCWGQTNILDLVLSLLKCSCFGRWLKLHWLMFSWQVLVLDAVENHRTFLAQNFGILEYLLGVVDYWNTCSEYWILEYLLRIPQYWMVGDKGPC